MRDWIQKRLPTEESLQGRPGLGWLRPLLRRRVLWHLSRRRVALGAGIGVFFGLMVPIAQIAGAALFAWLLRANLPVAAVATLVSNPLTFAPIVLLAYEAGAALLGEQLAPAAAEAMAEAATPMPGIGPVDEGWLAQAGAIGKPLVLGLALFAVVGGVGTWALVHVAWILAVRLKRRRRLRQRAQQG